jgi:prolyl oligopeptidase
MKINTLLVIMMISATLAGFGSDKDPFKWLEEVEGEKALEWVHEKNSVSLDLLMSRNEYPELYKKNLEIYNSRDRIPAPSILGRYIYNFWQDETHERGIWRRCTKESYLDGNPDWEILLDIDELSKADGVQWVFKGGSGLFPDYSRFMVYLSRGGGDAVVIREFDVNTRSFLNEGFDLPESKGSVSWIDQNRLLVAVDFGEGSMTTSGYPRQVKIWERGTSIEDAPVIFEGEKSDVGSFGSVINKAGKQYTVIQRAITFYTSHIFLLENGKPVKLDVPDDANLEDILSDQIIVSLKSDWEAGGKKFGQGSLVSLSYPALLAGKHEVSLIVEPDERSGITSASASKSNLIVNMLTNVRSELFSWSFSNGTWTSVRVETPDHGAIRLGSVDNHSDEYFFYYENFLTPSSLYFANSKDNTVKLIQSLPAFFDSENYKIWQYEARSADGTMVPYFVVGPAHMEYNGNNPTLLYAYGGFEVSMLPFYSAIFGNSWLDRGGVFVLANIRGGGEFGPGWHQAGLKEKRQNVFDDFHAVAEDLIDRGITSGSRLGIQGGSNGGLLVGVAFTQRPDLYGAVVCQVPLLDMKRYNKLLAGASWMGEYGDPDIPEEWDFIKRYSPYHNLKEDQPYPAVFFTTSTRDDRVHPGHARKMVAKMEEMGYKVYYYENTEGGHAGASTNEQRARTSALGFTYLLMKLGK